ncbi:MAG TPA: hypothetical protein VIL32_07590, partial [Steroidobacteraceae bacterium]
ARLIVKEPVFACRDAQISAQKGPTGPLSMQASAQYNSEAGSLSVEGAQLAIAGGRVRFSAHTHATTGWALEGDVTGLDLVEARKLAAPWIRIPDNLTFDGKLDLNAKGSGRADSARMQLQARVAGMNFSNETGTVVAEKLGATLRGTATRSRAGLSFDAQIESASGQALAGPVFADLGANPLQASAQGTFNDGILELTAINIGQRNVIDAHARASVRIADAISVSKAVIDIERLLFPGAYTSFMQLRLAATPFGALQVAGQARGHVEIADNRVVRANAELERIGIEDERGKFSMADVQGVMYWNADPNASAQPSRLTWSRGSAYGLSGGETEIRFTAHGLSFELAPNSRIPVFDGALVIQRFAVRQDESGAAELDLDARLEPISMPLLSHAFGWPEMSGQLSGQIPGVRYRNRELVVEGDLVASVFDGQIVGRNFRLRDPLGPWPRLFADVTARRLDLSLVTRTFPIGSITGRLDADIMGLELFNWSPVAFDARLYTTPGDRSKHLISQRAITSISSVGGGWSRVPAALQTGVLRFFDDFRYDTIGLTCQLRNDVCLMGGIEPVRDGYYIVKGGGLPRIDVIGNAGRVDWPELVSRIVSRMKSAPTDTPPPAG